ncbi:MAG: 3-keto-5-aminohexanoate cleavage protein [Deltaproteobacteria bacterium]|nr:3-keto-5-aminohexanoate cleavage protein [Deltaproteobacteria bacterium]
MPKFILNCAVTGAIHTPTMAPHLPIKPKDIAAQAIEAVEAGASTVHVHARNPENGLPTGDVDLMGEIVSVIHAKSNGVICITTGGGINMTVDERLAAVPRFKPELASCNLGSMNFALFPVLAKFKEWKYDWEEAYLEGSRDFIFRNTFADLDRVFEIMDAVRTKPELEAYDVGHLHNAALYYNNKRIEEPVYIQFVMGILGGIAATIPHLLHMKETAQSLFGDKIVFSTIAAGWRELPMGTTSMFLGGGVRVGLEDNLWLAPGEMAASNAQLVEKMVRIAGEFGYEPYSPDETREVLGLKGQGRVQM